MKSRALVAATVMVLWPQASWARANCLSDAEVETAVVDQVRAKRFLIDTSALPDLPLCSAVPLGMQIQRIRARLNPEEVAAADRAQEAVVAADNARLAAVAQVPPAQPEPLPMSASPPAFEAEATVTERVPPRARAKVRASAPKPRRQSASYFKSCAAARAAGAAPLRSGQPGYSRRLDRDGDGVACE